MLFWYAPTCAAPTDFSVRTTITGHSLKDVEAILDAHYLGRTTKLAVSAVAKLEPVEADKRTDEERNCKTCKPFRFAHLRKSKIVECERPETG
jgi:hypothetical protein